MASSPLLLISIGSVLLATIRAVPQGRIVGGQDAIEGQFPHQVSIQARNEHICGGSIISRDYILTAAHCVGDWDYNGRFQKDDPHIYSVLAGTNNLLKGGVLSDVISIDVHENFNDILDDVALLKLAKPLNFSSVIQPINLTSTEIPDNSSVIISGWGQLSTYAFGELPELLQWNVLTSLSKEECQKEKFEFPLDSIICLAHEKNNGACSGDSGGPATFNGELVGIAGFVTDYCGSPIPDGYAKVSYHLEWIKNKMAENERNSNI